MLGMDPVLTGSLCFLVLAIVMYIKFIREHPLSDHDLSGDRRLHHHHHRAHKSDAIDPEDAVAFLQHPSVPSAQVLLPPMAKKQPLSPLQHPMATDRDRATHNGGGYGKHVHPSGYFKQQPMRRRAHSAATTTPSPHGAGNNGAGPSSHVLADAEMGLMQRNNGPDDVNPYEVERTSFDGTQQDTDQNVQMDIPPVVSSHRIDFEGLELDSGRGYSAGNTAPRGGPESADLLEMEMATPMLARKDGTAPAGASCASPRIDGKAATTASERPFFRDPVPQPAQMQLEVAKKAKIPLFLHSPMYVKPSAALLPDDAAQADHNNLQLKETKVPSRCHKNRSLHIDFSELEIGEMIGQGAFGTVHKAQWRGTVVAVKVLVCQYLTQEILEEFETEVQIMSILRHPNICNLMGACLEPPSRCLVIEYLPRGSLWNVLRQDVVIDYNMQITFARDTAVGMNYLHSFQPPILHRDLKSPNLLVDTNYSIKISDFGLARVRAHFQTMTGNCGTTQWMAPEVLAAEKYTEQADVFSFGVVLWEIITRTCPYDGLSQIQAALGVLNNSLRPTIPSHCPPLFKKLMTLCWISHPEQRPTFEQILELLPPRPDLRSTEP